MKFIMKTIRAILAPFILLWERLPSSDRVRRPAEAQAAVEAELADLKLYQFLACPFCVKVRRQMNRLDLPIEQRDTKRNEAWAEELLREGGSPKVPCLRIEEEGSVRWLYESGAINEYLEARFA